ncbi:hypothetical protein [Anatilimnocola floriformis]|uniref:hypothetical protein n=1 Tax=Anatilimnocola floriformis TaxID=2948575 RepID=UPI0020C1CF20|nr:hypothetical protein [Anatilimnocola floriformis]
MKNFDFPNFVLETPEDWFDVTADLDPGSPPTFMADDGLGELQVSIEKIPGGKGVQFTPEQLRGMLNEFAKGHDLGSPNNLSSAETPRSLLAANFVWNDDFLRVWYVSEPDQLAFITYTCEKNATFANELQIVETIIRSLRFK